MKRWLVGLVLLITATACGDDATGPQPIIELATGTITASGGSSVVTPALYVPLVIGTTDADTIFGRTFVRAGDAGRTFVATADTDPGFVGAVATLTNGVADQIQRSTYVTAGGGGGSTISTEAQFFATKIPPGVDFQGYEIESIRLIIDAIFLQTPGNDPNGNGIWTDYQLQARVVIRGREL